MAAGGGDGEGLEESHYYKKEGSSFLTPESVDTQD